MSSLSYRVRTTNLGVSSNAVGSDSNTLTMPSNPALQPRRDPEKATAIEKLNESTSRQGTDLAHTTHDPLSNNPQRPNTQAFSRSRPTVTEKFNESASQLGTEFSQPSHDPSNNSPRQITQNTSRSRPTVTERPNESASRLGSELPQPSHDPSNNSPRQIPQNASSKTSSAIRSKITSFMSPFSGRKSATQFENDSKENISQESRGRASLVNATVQRISISDLKPEAVVIAIMGPTGAGKTSFLNLTTGADEIVGHQLMSCTSEIHAVEYSCPERSDLNIIFVDTPGFDDTNKTDLEVLEMIANWLEETYKKQVHLSGILYLHRISDNRMAGTPLKNLQMFEKLCGKNALQNIILTTTMWDLVDDDEGTDREKELVTQYWRPMIRQGSRAVRFEKSKESGWRIIEDFLEDGNRRAAVLLQKEMVDMKMQLKETKAGQELYTRLDVLVRKQQDLIGRIRKELTGQSDPAVLTALQTEYSDLHEQLKATVDDLKVLKLSPGRRLLRLVRSPLDWRRAI